MVALLFSYQGRINRLQYWTASIAVGVIGLLAAVMLLLMSGVTFQSSKEDLLRGVTGFMLTLIPLVGVMAWIGNALQVKRLHDRGQSGVWALLPMALSMVVTFGGLILLPVLLLVQLGMLINLGFLPGAPSENKFGPPPGTPNAATPKTPSGKQAAALNTLFGAEQAIERALAEQKLSAPIPRTAPASGNAGGQPSFGRRGAH